MHVARKFFMTLRHCITALLCFAAANTALAEAPANFEKIDGESQQDCVVRALEISPDDVTIADIRIWCGNEPTRKEQSVNALRARLHLEKNTRLNPFVMTPHNRNYIMPASYWTNKKWNDNTKKNDKLNSMEVKFQLSLKIPIKTKLFNFYDVYFAYTQTNFFQLYNVAQSSHFREINYMPELYTVRNLDWQFGPINTELVGFGFVHQSNGKDIPASRSWDRLFFQYVATTGPYYWELKPWWRIPESYKRKDQNSPRRDDNPDIEKYMGHFELRVIRPVGNHTTELLLRNNLRSSNRGAVQLDYTFPLKGRFKGIVQVFSGYGDSLINYNDYQNR